MSATGPPAKQMRIQSLNEPESVHNNSDVEQFDTTFLSLNDDVCMAIFEKLSLDDVCALSKTCKRLHALGSEHFVRRYKSKSMIIDRNPENMLIKGPYGERYIDCFGKSVQNVVLLNYCYMIRALHQLRIFYGDENSGDDSPIKTLHIQNWHGVVLEPHGYALAAIVKNVNELTLSDTNLSGDLNVCLFRYMPNLKRLTVRGYTTTIKSSKLSWMRQRYPNMEYFSMYLKPPICLTKDIKQFLELNLNIKFFSLEMDPVFTIQMLIKDKIRVNELFVKLEGDLLSILSDLQVLCEQGNCKHLHLMSKNVTRLLGEPHIDQLVSLSPFIKGLYLENTYINNDLATAIIKIDQLNQLKVLQLKFTPYDTVLTLNNLEELCVDTEDFNRSNWSYISRLPSLKKVYLPRTYLNQEQLAIYNSERMKLTGAHKLQIYYNGLLNKLNENQCEYDVIEMVRDGTEIIANPWIAANFCSVRSMLSFYIKPQC